MHLMRLEFGEREKGCSGLLPAGHAVTVNHLDGLLFATEAYFATLTAPRYHRRVVNDKDPG